VFMIAGSQTLIEAQFAGMADEQSGLLGRNLWPVERVTVPAYLALEGDRLYWEWWTPDHRGHTRERDATGALDAFLRIQNGRDVLRFAQRYGHLMLCRDGVPASHHRPPLGEPPGWCPPLGAEEGRNWEPVDRWLYYVRRANALVRVAAALHGGELGQESDWRILSEHAALPRESLHTRRSHLAAAIWGWLDLARVQPGLTWDTHPPELRLWSGAGTFGVLGVQLLIAVSQSHGLAVCTSCSRPYLREQRAVQAGRGNYCPACGERGGARVRKQRQRERERQ
jgi:hypothetical protein